MQQHYSNVHKHDTPGHPKGSRTTGLPYRLVYAFEGLNQINNLNKCNKVLNVVTFVFKCIKT